MGSYMLEICLALLCRGSGYSVGFQIQSVSTRPGNLTVTTRLLEVTVPAVVRQEINSSSRKLPLKPQMVIFIFLRYNMVISEL